MQTRIVRLAYQLSGRPPNAVRWEPGVGRLRLATPPPPRPPRRPVAADAPIVLFLPAHDEEATVGAVVGRAPATVAGRAVRVLVVDDGSTDATAERARAAGAEVVASSGNEGLGAAVRRGLRHAVVEEGAAAVAFCDADGEYAPEELERLVGPVLDGSADYVVGSRFAGAIEHMLPHRRFGNVVLTRALRWCARTPITAGQSGDRAFSADAAAAAEVIHDYNYAQVLTLDLLAKGYRYREVPISYHFREEGRSFVRLGRYLRKVVPAVYRELNAA
jgi:glycosyltransferase involved in cell wall biosynthesis